MRRNKTALLALTAFLLAAAAISFGDRAYGKQKPKPQKQRFMVLPFDIEDKDRDTNLTMVAPALKTAIEYKMSRAPLIEIVHMTQLETVANERNIDLDKSIEVTDAFVLARTQNADLLITGKLSYIDEYAKEEGKEVNYSKLKFLLDARIIDMKTGEIGRFFDAKGVEQMKSLNDVSNKVVAEVVKYAKLQFKGAAGAKIRKMMMGMPTAKYDALTAFAWGEAFRLGRGGERRNIEEGTKQFEKAVAADPEFIDAHYGLGRTYFARGDYEKALTALANADKLNPENDEVKFWIAECHRKMKNYGEAYRYYDEALAIYPQFGVAKVNEGIALEEENKIEDAIKSYKNAIGINKDLVTPFIHLGKLLYNRGEYDEAAKALRRALEILPKNSTLHRLLGEVYERTGKPNDAVKEYEEAIALNPKDGDAYQALGNILASQGKFGRAIKTMEKAIVADPNSPAPLYGLAAVYERQGNREEALKGYEKALLIDDKNVVALNKTANLALSLGDKEKAKKYFDAAYDIEPTYGDTAYRLCLLIGDTTDWKRIENVCRSGATQKPAEKILLLYAGRALYFLGKEEEALKTLEEAAATLKDDHRPFMFLGEIYDKRGDVDKAINNYKKSLEKKPLLKVADAVRKIAEAEKRWGDAGEAYEIVAKAKGRRGGEKLFLLAADAYKKAHNKEAAKRAYLGALSITPDDNDMRFEYVNFLVSEKELNEAVTQLFEIIGRDAKNYNVRYTLGVVRERQDNVAAAIVEYNRCLQMDKERPEAYNALALIHARNKEYKNVKTALEYAHKAVELTNSNNDLFLATLAEAYFADGDEDEAIKYIKRAIILNPERAYYKQLLKKYEDN
ncbi:MAG: hypothetical protein Kow0090_12440 [Myxococcota bacterium]